MKVLIAEDDPISRRILEAMLVKWGYCVVTAEDGEQALEALMAQGAPPIAILDRLMPGIDGANVCRKVREKENGTEKYTYLILLTIKGSKEDIVSGMEAGADDYIAKPYDEQELRVRLSAGRRIIDLHKELTTAKNHLLEQSRTDPLTGILNRRAVLSELHAQMARHHGVRDFIFASSSSVYGGNQTVPFRESDSVDRPVSLYAATKRANEIEAYAYHHLYGLNCWGLRFFTVYGPWGRPDMAIFKFTKNILAGQPIEVYNQGNHRRDFTYIDDITSGVLAAIDRCAGYEIFNLGNNQPVELERLIAVIETVLGAKADKRYLPLQPGDVVETYADIEKANRQLGFAPTTPIETGVQQFVEWFKTYQEIL